MALSFGTGMASRRREEDQVDKSKKAMKAVISARRRERNRAEAAYPGQQMEWYGGILYFVGVSSPFEVPGVPHLPKPGKEAVGVTGGQPAAAIHAPHRDADNSWNRRNSRW